MACPHCGAQTHAPFPDEMQAPIQYGPNILTLMAYLHYYQVIPFARLRGSSLAMCGICP